MTDVTRKLILTAIRQASVPDCALPPAAGPWIRYQSPLDQFASVAQRDAWPTCRKRRA
jgi:hypothetical protein